MECPHQKHHSVLAARFMLGNSSDHGDPRGPVIICEAVPVQVVPPSQLRSPRSPAWVEDIDGDIGKDSCPASLQGVREVDPDLVLVAIEVDGLVLTAGSRGDPRDVEG